MKLTNAEQKVYKYVPLAAQEQNFYDVLKCKSQV